MRKLSILSLFIFFSCKNPVNNLSDYSDSIGYDTKKHTLLISFESCKYCFGNFQESVNSLDVNKFNIVIISSEKKLTSLFVSSNFDVYWDKEKLAIKMGLINSMPVIISPKGDAIEILSSDQLLNYAKNI